MLTFLGGSYACESAAPLLTNSEPALIDDKRHAILPVDLLDALRESPSALPTQSGSALCRGLEEGPTNISALRFLVKPKGQDERPPWYESLGEKQLDRLH